MEVPLILCSLGACFRYDVDHSQFIDLMELKMMMEKLGEPQTHLGLKEMIKEVDEDKDNQISFREVGTNLWQPRHAQASGKKKASPISCCFFPPVTPLSLPYLTPISS